jgi:hypothetical protein
VQSKQDDILEVLRMRFESDAEPLRASVAAITDLEVLKQLLRAAVKAPDAAAFQAELVRH